MSDYLVDYVINKVYVIVISQYEWVILVITRVRGQGLISKITHEYTGLYPGEYTGLNF